MKLFLNILFHHLFLLKLISENFNPVLLYHSVGYSSNFNNNIDHINLDILNSQLKYSKIFRCINR